MATELVWCNGPLLVHSVRLVGQAYIGTCKCGRHGTRAIRSEGAFFAQAHVRHGGK